MKRRTRLWVFLAAGTLLLSGCEETVSSQSHVRPPAQTPAPVPAFLHESLPFPNHPVEYANLRESIKPRLQAVIEQTEAAFNAGQKEYQAGNLDAARADFDRAESLVLESGFAVDSDPQLSRIFDQIGNAMEDYERDAAKGASDEPETAGDPAPIDEIADLTLPPGDPRLARMAELEIIKVPHDLPLTVNDSVLPYLSYFTSPRGHEIVEHGLDRSGRYSAMIRRVLHEEGVPEDLIYLAQAESAFLPQAVSRAGARGIWQFMPYRGEEYDLERNYWVDERSDPEKATRAAARHMRDLYDMFGDWYLVMAAYNSGPMNVIRAIERTGYADFWDLQRLHALPKQTQNYVPIIIALALVAKDPSLYGVQVQPDKTLPADTVALGHSIDLHLVADATGADLEDLRDLNPELLRNVTPNDPDFALKVPAGTAAKLKEDIEQVPEDKWTSWRLHAMDSGETLGDVARQYRVTLASLETANHLEPHASVPAGFLLDVPTAPPVVRLVHYRVQRGDTLEGIADRYDVTISELRRWNHLRGNRAPRGARLRIYAGGEPAPASRRASSKTGASESRGESAATSQEVSRKSGPGMPDSGRSDSAQAATTAVDPIHHRVKRGETIYSIAHAFKTSVGAIQASNPFLSERPLEAGDVLTIDR